MPQGATTTTNPFATFDFKNGTAYPTKAAVSIGTVSVPVGATEAFVPIRINRNTPNTVIVRVMTRNGTGTLAGIEGRHFQKTATTVFFRPGDALEQLAREGHLLPVYMVLASMSRSGSWSPFCTPKAPAI